MKESAGVSMLILQIRTGKNHFVLLMSFLRLHVNFFFLKNKSFSCLFPHTFVSTQHVSLFVFKVTINSSSLPGPGAVDTPTVSRLHPRSATVTWLPPAPPNGIITNYTICLCPSSMCSNNTTLNYSMIPNSDPDRSSDQALRPTPSPVTPGSSPISTSAFGKDNSNSVQDSGPSLNSSPPSSLKSGVTKDHRIRSRHEPDRNHQGPSSFSLHPAELNASPTSASAGSEASLETEHSPTSGCFSAASASSLYPRSVTVSGNSTSYTFLQLQPYQTYSCQVRTGCCWKTTWDVAMGRNSFCTWMKTSV